MSFLEICDLIFTYPGSPECALDGLNMNAERGQIVAVIGPNAAGKSTFALVLKGLLKPDSGKIRINGVCREASGPDAGVGILFSNPENQLVTSIVEEDIAFGLEVLGEPSHVIREKVDAVLARLGMEHLRKRMPHLMSGGEQQMAALAGVLVLDPEIIVLDEPTTYLDPDSRAKVLSFMRHLADQGKVIILITHDMKEAAIADRITLLDRGRTVAEGPPEEVFGRSGLSEQYGISPPFTFRLFLELRELGMGIQWTADPAALARAVLSGLKGHPVGLTGDMEPASRSDGRMPALTYDQIWFGYGHGSSGGMPILKGVDFSVERGSMNLICGANGSGKSTLLQMSNGLVDPDSGQVLVDGQPLKALRKRRGGIPSHVSLLFQNPERQLFSSTAFEDIAFGPRNMRLSSKEVEDRVISAARWAGLPEAVLERPVFSLSGGQMRRVAVAGSLAMEPDLLVLDEPADGLDPGSTREFYERASQYCDETGTTILIAAHAVPEEIACFDHLGHLADGKIQSSGYPPDILAGTARTLPGQFLPDHLVLAEELEKSGIPFTGGMLDPVAMGKYLLNLLEELPA